MRLTHQGVLSMLPERSAHSHKGDYGKILLLCGSVGFTGAAALAAMGALRSGAGLVYVGVPESIYVIEAVKLTEAIVFPLPDEDGKLSAKSIPIIALTANAFDEDVQRSLQAGLDAHLSKPVDPDNLFETLEGLIKD